ncbi:MAG: hypothetical protein O9342_10400 [Beijerinckiaceae bacterium]|nr:hypothetical protein [Beijerinckiaceae bacterium]
MSGLARANRTRVTGAVLGLLGLALQANSAIGQAALPVKPVQSGPSFVVMDQARDQCDRRDGPDTPAVAFRNAKGDIVLFASSYRNVPLAGPSLARMRKVCGAGFAAAGNPEPDLLDDRTWIDGVYTEDGVNITALGSASYIPHRHGRTCAAGPARTDCWLNGIVGLKSSDGGMSFRYISPPPNHLVLPPDDRFSDQVRVPRGYVWTTNLVLRDGWLNTLVRVRTHNGVSKTCLMRVSPKSAYSWEYWNGRAFADIRDGGKNRCAPIGGRGNFPARGLSFLPEKNLWIAVYDSRTAKDPPGRGVFYRVSRDLVEWSEPSMMLWIPLAKSRTIKNQSFLMGYPSIIDETSKDRNFGQIGQNFHVLHMEAYTDETGATFRKLMATPFRLAP